MKSSQHMFLRIAGLSKCGDYVQDLFKICENMRLACLTEEIGQFARCLDHCMWRFLVSSPGFLCPIDPISWEDLYLVLLRSYGLVEDISTVYLTVSAYHASLPSVRRHNTWSLSKTVIFTTFCRLIWIETIAFLRSMRQDRSWNRTPFGVPFVCIPFRT